MKLLQIASFVPYPVDDGGRAGIFNITRELVKNGVEVTFAAPRINANDAAGFSRLANVCLVDVDPTTTFGGMLRHLTSSTPYNVAKYYSAKAEGQLHELVRNGKFDAIHIDSLHLALYGIRLKERWGLPIALREHNFESEIMRRFRDLSRNPLVRAYASLQLRRLLAFEGRVASQFDRVFPISAEDDRKLKELSPGARTEVIPAGVDTATVRFRSKHIDGTVLFLLNYQWLPNRDSFDFFVESILPEIERAAPEVTTVVAGKGTEKIPGGHRSLKVAGYLTDVNAVADIASVAIVPLRIGSGMRIKILELMAMGRVVITTSVGIEGIEAKSGVHCIIADDARTFAASVLHYLRSPQESLEMGVRARQLVEERYSWDAIGRKFVDAYEDLIRGAVNTGRGSGGRR